MIAQVQLTSQQEQCRFPPVYVDGAVFVDVGGFQFEAHLFAVGGVLQGGFEVGEGLGVGLG